MSQGILQDINMPHPVKFCLEIQIYHFQWLLPFQKIFSHSKFSVYFHTFHFILKNQYNFFQDIVNMLHTCCQLSCQILIVLQLTKANEKSPGDICKFLGPTCNSVSDSDAGGQKIKLYNCVQAVLNLWQVAFLEKLLLSRNVSS